MRLCHSPTAIARALVFCFQLDGRKLDAHQFLVVPQAYRRGIRRAVGEIGDGQPSTIVILAEASFPVLDVEIRFGGDRPGQRFAGFPCRKRAQGGMLAEQLMDVPTPRPGQSDDKNGGFDGLVFDLRMAPDQFEQAQSGPQHPSDFMVKPIAAQEMIIAILPGLLEKAREGFPEIGSTVIGKASSLAYLAEKLLGGKREGILRPWAHDPVGEPNGQSKSGDGGATLRL